MTRRTAQALLAGQRRVAVIQPLPGIGDTVWHLPHIRAIAACVGRPVTLVAKPRSAADQLFMGEPAIEQVLWLDRNPEHRQHRQGRHDGIGGFVRMVGTLRRQAFDAVVLLHHSQTLAAAACAAGIAHRFGYGYRLQRPFLNRPPYLTALELSLVPHAQATAWLAAAGIPLGQADPALSIAPERRIAARRQLGVAEAPLVAIGIGTSEPYKQWGAARFTELAAALLDAGWPRLVLAGGPAEGELAEAIRGGLGERAGAVVAVLGWNLADLAALLAEAEFCVGNDTGVMNLAAAAGTRSYGLFGATPPLRHSRCIVPVLPPDGRIDIGSGMARITDRAVLAAIEADRGGLGPAVDPDQCKQAAGPP